MKDENYSLLTIPFFTQHLALSTFYFFYFFLIFSFAPFALSAVQPSFKRNFIMRVIKVSGHELDQPHYVAQFAEAVAHLHQQEPVIVVHGGGKSIKELQEKLGLQEQKIDGLRVTDADSLLITEMVMNAQINKLVVRALQKVGLEAWGLSGIDAHLLTAAKKHHPKGDLGFVGEIVAVKSQLLHQLLQMGYTPVISPVSCDPAGQTYNINADEAAMAIAQAIQATQLDFVSNVPGVLYDRQDPHPIPTLTFAQIDQLLAEGIISGGMIPKVQAAVQAVQQGVQNARIVNLAGLAHAGTVITTGEV